MAVLASTAPTIVLVISKVADEPSAKETLQGRAMLIKTGLERVPVMKMVSVVRTNCARGFNLQSMVCIPLSMTPPVSEV